MKKLHVFNYWDRPCAGLLKELLENEGVDCLLRNEQLSAAVGEIPFVECCPELWVIDDEVFPRARILLDSWFRNDGITAEPWTCSHCGERSEGQFGACWSCGTLRDETNC